MLTFGSTLDLVVKTLYTFLNELVTLLAEFEEVLSIGSLRDELLENRRDDGSSGLVLVKGGSGDYFGGSGVQ
jgi:hypothetical protein